MEAFLLNLSHKIKFNLSNQKNKKPLEEQPNEKISIKIGDYKARKNLLSNRLPIKRTIIINEKIKPVIYDNQLFKQFSRSSFNKVDLHGLTVNEAHDRLIEYFNHNYNIAKLLHIVITGLGNKSNHSEFFTGKIRKAFPLWLETKKFEKYVKSFSACKSQHGGLGAFYVKLKLKV